MSARTPPFPGKDLNAWARLLHNYLVGESQIKQRVEPTAILLAHRKDTVIERAATDGILLFDPVAKVPVFSKDGAFVALGGGGGAFLPLAGGVMTGLLTTTASVAGGAGLRLPPGVAPTSPVNGDIWTTSAGVFARIAGNTLNLSPPFANAAEARAGTRTDAVMSPATVAARQGVQTFNLAGQIFVSFDQVPEGVTMLDIILSAAYPANSTVDLLFPGDPSATYQGSRQVMAAAYAAPAAFPTTSFLLETNTAAGTVQGMIRQRLNNSGLLWFTESNLRRSGGGVTMASVGICVLTLNAFRPRIRCNAPFTSGEATLRWRI